MIKHFPMMLSDKFNPPSSLQDMLDTCSDHTVGQLSRKLEETGWKRIDGWLCFTNPTEQYVVKLSRNKADTIFSHFAQSHPDAKDNPHIVQVYDQKSAQDGVMIIMEELERMEYASPEADMFEKIYELYMGIRYRDKTSTAISESELETRIEDLKRDHPDIFDTLRAMQQYLLQQVFNGNDAQRGVYSISNRLDVQRGNVMTRKDGDQRQLVFIDHFKDRYMESDSPEPISRSDQQTLRLFQIDFEEIRRNPDPFLMTATENQFGTLAQE